MTAPLTGRVVALIGSGDDAHRAAAVACAEAGADIALATTRKTQQEEFAVNSIANEIWAIGRDHLVCLIDSADEVDVTAFAAQVWDRFGRCDLLVAAHDLPSTAPLDELSGDEWRDALTWDLSAPFFAAQAFGRLMERAGSGRILFLVPEVPGADAAYVAARAGLAAASEAINEAWGASGVHAEILRGDAASFAAAVVSALEPSS